MKRALFTLLAFVPMEIAMAQTPDTTPPAEIANLKWMVGTWTGSGKFSIQGQEMDVATTMTCSMEGQFMKSVSVNDYGVIKLEETMYIGYDADKKEYVSYAFTNMSPAPRIEHGKMDGASMVMTSEPWNIMGTAMTARGTLTKLSDTKVKMILEFKNDTGWQKASDMELTKTEDGGRKTEDGRRKTEDGRVKSISPLCVRIQP